LSSLRIGVLSLQGDFREHIRSVESCGHQALGLNRADELASIDGLILPGGESTTIMKLAESFNLTQPIREFIASGAPVYGSCAGMILLADEISGAPVAQAGFGGIDITVRRNAFGRQVDSFESAIEFQGILDSPVMGIFIRAPWVERVGKDVEILASVESGSGEHPVAVREGNLLATSFHPELTGDLRVHQFFINEIIARR